MATRSNGHVADKVAVLVGRMVKDMYSKGRYSCICSGCK